MFRKFEVLGLVFFVVAAAWSAPACAEPAIVGKPYARARIELMKQGYYPVRLSHDPDIILCSDGFCKQYPEVIDCSGTGSNYCSFAWANPTGKYRIVETHGETKYIVDEFRNVSADEAKDIGSSKPHQFPISREMF